MTQQLPVAAFRNISAPIRYRFLKIRAGTPIKLVETDDKDDPLSMDETTRPRLLCVDDDGDLLQSIAPHLEPFYEVDFATTAMQGLRLLEQHPDDRPRTRVAS